MTLVALHLKPLIVVLSGDFMVRYHNFFWYKNCTIFLESDLPQMFKTIGNNMDRNFLVKTQISDQLQFK